jgi:hypothetical protein
MSFFPAAWGAEQGSRLIPRNERHENARIPKPQVHSFAALGRSLTDNNIDATQGHMINMDLGLKSIEST